MEQIHLYTRDELDAMGAYELRNLVEAAQVAHVTDIQLLADTANALAERRGYCSTYDEVVAELEGVSSVPFPARKRTWTVSVTVPVYITLASVQIEAATLEDAQAQAVASVQSNGVDNATLVERVREWSYSERLSDAR